MDVITFFQRVMNWFIPEHMAHDLHVRKRVQMFIISHLFGPIIATPIPVFLWFAVFGARESGCCDGKTGSGCRSKWGRQG